jgi:DNA-binding response OmpR family regulator
MIQTTLEIGGYTSEICVDGEAAVRRILIGGLDLVLLDVMLPKLDGFAVIERIGDAQMPVIFLTAMDDVSNKVRGLRLGAEDYIVKPFEAMELLVRIEVALRRTKRDVSQVLSFGDITVDVGRHQASLNGIPVQLTPKEFELLVFFIRNIDIALTRDRLLSVVWGYEFSGGTRTVDTHIQQLRKKLNLHDSLATISRLGYRLESVSEKDTQGGAQNTQCNAQNSAHGDTQDTHGSAHGDTQDAQGSAQNTQGNAQDTQGSTQGNSQNNSQDNEAQKFVPDGDQKIS